MLCCLHGPQVWRQIVATGERHLRQRWWHKKDAITEIFAEIKKEIGALEGVNLIMTLMSILRDCFRIKQTLALLGTVAKAS